MFDSVFITLFQVVLLEVLKVGHRPGSYERILLGSRSPLPPPSGCLPGRSIGIKAS
jgi:hypothetical protein